MSILVQPPALNQSFRFVVLLLVQFRRFVNRWVANTLANRARQADRFVASRQLGRSFHRLSTSTPHIPRNKEDIMNSVFKSKSMSKSTLFAASIIGLVMMSLVPASAATVVRNHRDPPPAPVVRDHRAGAPVVRDHRRDSPVVRDHRSDGGGVTVRNTPPKRKPVDCLGNLCHVKKVCIGPACF